MTEQSPDSKDDIVVTIRKKENPERDKDYFKKYPEESTEYYSKYPQELFSGHKILVFSNLFEAIKIRGKELQELVNQKDNDLRDIKKEKDALHSRLWSFKTNTGLLLCYSVTILIFEVIQYFWHTNYSAVILSASLLLVLFMYSHYGSLMDL